MTGTGDGAPRGRLTPAQLSNLLPLTAWGYAWWRARSLTLLTGEPFSLVREARLFLARCRPQPGECWLDAGTSTGFYAGVLAEQGCRVVAADLSPAMLRAAARRSCSAQIRWALANLEDWPPSFDLSGPNPSESGPSEFDPFGKHTSFDGVTIGATLNETAHPARLLGNCARLLRPGGKLWLMWVCPTGGAGQRLLAGLGGLSFPDLSWVQAQLPDLTLRHARRAGPVQFALFQKTSA